MPYITNDGIKICYEIIDECDGEYLLLHTGLNSTKEAWIESSYTDELKMNFKLVLIDPRGHGQSDKPRDLRKYSFKKMVEDVIALLDSLKIDKIHFFGYSLGGLVGWLVAKYHPERIKTFIAGGSRVITNFTSNPFLRLEFLKEGPVENKDLDLEQLNVEDILPKLEFPVLTFVGDKDNSCYPHVEEFSKLIPDCTSFTLEGLDHPQAIIQKDKVIPHVIAFLEKNTHTS